MLRLILFALAAYVIWKGVRFAVLVYRAYKEADRQFKQEKTGSLGEKDITGKVRIIEGDSADGR